MCNNLINSNYSFITGYKQILNNFLKLFYGVFKLLTDVNNYIKTLIYRYFACYYCVNKLD